MFFFVIFFWNILLVKYFMEDLEEKNGNIYEEIVFGFYSGKGRIKLLYIFFLGNKSNIFLFLFKINRISYRFFIFF